VRMAARRGDAAEMAILEWVDVPAKGSTAPAAESAAQPADSTPATATPAAPAENKLAKDGATPPAA
jgi:hypothetical protein